MLPSFDVAVRARVANPGGGRSLRAPEWRQRRLESIPIDPTKTVAEVILPSSSTELSTASAPFHVFALGIGTPAAASSAQSTQANRR